MEWAFLLTGGGLVLIGVIFGSALKGSSDKKETDV